MSCAEAGLGFGSHQLQKDEMLELRQQPEPSVVQEIRSPTLLCHDNGHLTPYTIVPEKIALALRHPANKESSPIQPRHSLHQLPQKLAAFQSNELQGDSLAF